MPTLPWRAPAVAVLAATLVAGCGAAARQSTQSQSTTATQPSAIAAISAHPQAVDPAATGPSTATSTGVSVQSPSNGALAQPATLDQIRQELSASGLSADTEKATLTPAGLAIAPLNAPPQVQEAIDAGNEIAHLPYRFGGGHGTFIDTAYDCSGSLSFMFAAAGILKTTMTSGQLESWGDPGPGKWITVFANDGHTFAYIAGLRFDTVALAETGSRWSDRSADEPDLHSFVIRHPPGL